MTIEWKEWRGNKSIGIAVVSNRYFLAEARYADQRRETVIGWRVREVTPVGNRFLSEVAITTSPESEDVNRAILEYLNNAK